MGRPIFSELRVQGFWLDHWLRQATLEEQQRVFSHPTDLLAKRAIVPRAGPSFDLEDIADALARASDPVGRSGKVLLTSCWVDQTEASVAALTSSA